MTRHPYVYRIKSRDGHFYYGCRFALGCHPDDLWVSYFTSSKAVSNLLEEHGSDYFQHKIVFRCESPEEALRLEGELIAATHKMKGCLNQFLCKRDGTPVFLGKYGTPSDETRKKISEALTGKVRTPEMNARNSKAQMGKKWTDSHYEKHSQRIQDPVYLKLASESQKGKRRTEAEKKHLSDLWKGKPKPDGFGKQGGSKLVEYNASLPIYLRPRALGCHDAWAKAHEFYLLWSAEGWGHERFCNRRHDGKNMRVFYNMFREFKTGWVPLNDTQWCQLFLN